MAENNSLPLDLPMEPMRKILILLTIFVIMIVAGVLIYQNLGKKPEEKVMEKILENPKGEPSVPYGASKKVAITIAFRDFRDEEYFVPKEILAKAGAEIKTASNKIGTAIGADGGEVEIDLLVNELKPADFDAVVFIGGPGCLENLDNENSYRVVKETISQDKILAAICIAPAILANAGVLEGKKATVWSSPLDKSAVKILQEQETIYQDEEVVVDGKIVTGNGPGASRKFAEAIVELLK